MSMFLGPLDATGRVPPRQQTRVAAFLVSCHGAMARQLALALAWPMKAAWHTELNAQFYRESEIVSLLLRATSWIPDPELLFLLPSWEAAWLPRATEGIADRTQGLTIDIAAGPRPTLRDTAGSIAAAGNVRAGSVCAGLA